MTFRVERATAAHVDAICAIERSAVEMFRGHQAWPFYRAVSIPPDQLAMEIQQGLVWVALPDDSDEPVGFVWLDTEHGGRVVGIAEIDVLPAYGRRGIGSALLNCACEWARSAGYRRVDLGTLADVPWNAPFYAKHGFSIVDKHDPDFAYARERDEEHGFPETLRVFMTRRLAPPDAHEWSVWPAPAKLDLLAPPVKPRDDEPREWQRIVRLLDACDELRLRARTDDLIDAHAGNPAHAELARRAANLLREHAHIQAGADIRIEQRIPAGVGVAGESSLVATVLVALNHLWRTGLTIEQLAELGRELDREVPIFLHGRSVQTTLTHERATSTKLPQRWYVLIDPHESVAVEEIFQATELTRIAPAATISFFASGETLENVIEPVVRARYPRVAAAWDWLGSHGHARLSGSGGCVFLETATPERAEAVARRCPATFTAWVAEGVGVSPLRRALSRHAAAG
ncbi:4-(cytidine 5'-diphospho)-2-C-methyl-D-erythritol kinase [Dyella sp. 7MK23]|uniref:4-diphosphocytidyl-2-C-methyl-D-erythritol kinase n=2 Tax=Dyella acidiphila TaxID=2775866 RepID=A0ABR9G3Z2_9GAMM|nr:4-(cytidine 5'-diphospho)-2-C-methyl-D-erythritol kinase [Dyella acidiphila]MBE1158755.1 4-(cytidine 5'-diphospho)-2-C-methyl-D-erythritol kinase [Dyella acidiphila]